METEKLASPHNRLTHAMKVACAYAVLFVALSLGLVLFLWSGRVYHPGGEDLDSALRADPRTSTGALPVPAVAPGLETANIKQAMADCDTEAINNPEGLYFLLTPVEPANFDNATLLLPPGDDYKSFSLVRSEAVLRGLGNGSLRISARPYELSVVDTQTAWVKKWSTVSAPAKFSLQQIGTLQKFRIGLAFGDERVTWTNIYDWQKGNCYWVNIFLLARPYSPFSGRNFGVPKSFPAQARTLRCANHACESDADQ